MSGGKEFIWEGRGEGGRNARYTQFAGHAADDSRLAGLHFRVLAHVGRFNQNKGWVRLSQKELADRFSVRRPSINKVINELVTWGYLRKRSQKQSGESFCYYRTLIDEDGVSSLADTQGEGSVRPSDTRVSPPKTQRRSSSSDLKDPPLPPKGGRSSESRFGKKRKRQPAALPRFVSEDTLDRVRSIAPSWDRQRLLAKFLEWPGSRNARNMDAAFLGWVSSFTKGKEAA